MRGSVGSILKIDRFKYHSSDNFTGSIAHLLKLERFIKPVESALKTVLN